MNQDRCAGVIRQLLGAARQRWGKLTGDAVAESLGGRERRAGRMQERYGISKEMAAREFNEFLERNRNWDGSRQ